MVKRVSLCWHRLNELTFLEGIIGDNYEGQLTTEELLLTNFKLNFENELVSRG